MATAPAKVPSPHIYVAISAQTNEGIVLKMLKKSLKNPFINLFFCNI